MCLFRTQQDVSHFNSSFLELPFICVPQEKRVQLLVTFYKQLVHSTFRHGEKWCHFILPVWITTPTGPRNKWTHNHQFCVFSTSLRKQLHKGNRRWLGTTWRFRDPPAWLSRLVAGGEAWMWKQFLYISPVLTRSLLLAIPFQRWVRGGLEEVSDSLNYPPEIHQHQD